MSVLTPSPQRWPLIVQAPPSQGFFGKPVDNLHAEPLIARWIRHNVLGWREAVVVSKNPGGTKRVTSLADVLKLNFGLVTTDRRRNHGNSLHGSMILGSSGFLGGMTIDENQTHREEQDPDIPIDRNHILPGSWSSPRPQTRPNGVTSHPRSSHAQDLPNGTAHDAGPNIEQPTPQDSAAEEYTDERAREVISARLVQGHVVDDDFPSPSLSTLSSSAFLPGEANIGPPHFSSEPSQDPMASSFISTMSTMGAGDHALAGSTGESDEEDQHMMNPELEHTITLVGNVKDRTVLIIDDMIDGAASWIAAAETVVKRGDAKNVYCIATHGLFGDESLEQMEACKCIDRIVVTNSYPIEARRTERAKKLVVLDISGLLSEAIRRNHYGESISQLFQHYPD